jgi:hypothetical protein
MGINVFSGLLEIDYFDSFQREIDARIESGTPILGSCTGSGSGVPNRVVTGITPPQYSSSRSSGSSPGPSARIFAEAS